MTRSTRTPSRAGGRSRRRSTSPATRSWRSRSGEVVGYGDLGDQANDGTRLLARRPRRRAAARSTRSSSAAHSARRVPGGVVRVDGRRAATPSWPTLVAERGYRRIRSSYRMGIDLARRGHSHPSGRSAAAVRTSVEGVDEPLLYRIGEESFADHWGHTTDAVRGVAALAAQHGRGRPVAVVRGRGRRGACGRRDLPAARRTATRTAAGSRCSASCASTDGPGSAPRS